MKVGMNLLLWTAFVEEAHFPILEKIKKTGYDGVEIPLFDGDAEHYKKIKKELDNLGLGCTAVTVVNADTNPISPDASVRKAALDRIKWALDMTSVMGGDVLAGPYHSALGVFSGQPPTADERKRAVEVLTQAADHAQKVKVKIAIEYLNRFECYFLTNALDAKNLVREINHPYFGTMYDTFHANIEEKNISQAIASMEDTYVHVHISENDRGTPGSGHVHWDETFKALRKAKYDGWLTIEAFGRALPDLAAATKIWRDMFPSPEDVYGNGFKFIKEKWKDLQFRKPKTHALNIGFNYDFSNNVLGYDLGYWYKPSNIGLTYGASLLLRTDFTNTKIGFAPVLGYKIWQFHIQTGYQFLSKARTNFFTTNTLFIDIRFVLINNTKIKK